MHLDKNPGAFFLLFHFYLPLVRTFLCSFEKPESAEFIQFHDLLAW